MYIYIWPRRAYDTAYERPYRPEGTSYCAWDKPRAANTFRMPFHDPWMRQ